MGAITTTTGRWHTEREHHGRRTDIGGAISLYIGLFDPKNDRESARLVQQRVHLIGFIAERRFCEGEIQNSGFYLPNPGLLASPEAAARAFQTYPLRPV